MAAPPRRGGLSRGGPRALGLVACAVLLGGIALASVAVGAKSLALSTVIDAFTDYDGSLNGHVIVRDLRLPRTELGLLVGPRSGCRRADAGRDAQPARRPRPARRQRRAPPLLVVIAIYVFGVGGLLGYVWFAFAGAAAASRGVYAIGSAGRDGATPIKLALAGAAVTALLTSLTTASCCSTSQTLDQYRFWEVGSLAGRDADIAGACAPFVVVGVGLVALACGPALNALALGDDVARGARPARRAARAARGVAVVLLVRRRDRRRRPDRVRRARRPARGARHRGPDYRWILPYSWCWRRPAAGRRRRRPRRRPPRRAAGRHRHRRLGAPFFVWLVRRRNLAEL